MNRRQLVAYVVVVLAVVVSFARSQAALNRTNRVADRAAAAFVTAQSIRHDLERQRLASLRALNHVVDRLCARANASDRVIAELVITLRLTLKQRIPRHCARTVFGHAPLR